MRIQPFTSNTTQSQVIPLTGGLNETRQFLQIAGGELISCTNYEEADGLYAGYRSVRGYEAFDGQTSPSSVDISLSFNTSTLEETVDDTDREAARALITDIPGTGNPLGGFVFNNTVYVFRNNEAEDEAIMYKSTSTGWEIVSQGEVGGFAPSGSFRTFEYRFDGFNDNLPVVIITDGVSVARLFDGTTITGIDHANLPSGIFPSLAGAYNNRLYLGYAEGTVVFSGVGDPTNFDALADAGELFIGDEITNIVQAPGNTLIITCVNLTKVLKSVEYNDSSWVFQAETFSKTLGAFSNSAVEFLGDVYFASEEGVTYLAAAQEFGDFSANTITKKVQVTYDSSKNNIIGSLIDRTTSQYKLFFGNGAVLCFSFRQDKRIKSVTKLFYFKNIVKVFSGTINGEDEKFFLADDGFCYNFDKGTSFNGEVIPTRLETNYYHYKSSRQWKRFRRIQPDVDAEIGTLFRFKPTYTYGDKLVTPGLTKTNYSLNQAGGVWGVDKWGSFIWGGTAVNTSPIYLTGYGPVLSLSLSTTEKYRRPHTIQSITTDYSMGSRRI